MAKTYEWRNADSILTEGFFISFFSIYKTVNKTSIRRLYLKANCYGVREGEKKKLNYAGLMTAKRNPPRRFFSEAENNMA